MKIQNSIRMLFEVWFMLNFVDIILSDNLALLSATLRTFEQVGCDGNIVTLKCPAGTSISVELAQYGKAPTSKKACPEENTPAHRIKGSSTYKTNISCSLPSSLQNKWDEMTQGTWGRYSLLQTVVEACQKKRNCKFQATPRTFEGDPCLGERKYVEVAYKCRPYEFRSRVACENERIHLQCNPNSRVAIYSASYGRTEYENFQCPQPQGVAEETCLVKYATEIVMKLCHGNRSCIFPANTNIFGNPCRPETTMYLRIVYTCVPRRVLNEQYEAPLLDDEIEDYTIYNYEQEDFDNYDANNEHIREAAALPPSLSKNQSELKIKTTSVLPKFFPDTNSQSSFEDESKSINWFLISGFICGLLLSITLLVSAILIHRRRSKFELTNAVNQETTPNCFIDDLSEIEGDIDLNTTLSVVLHSPTSRVEVMEHVLHSNVQEFEQYNLGSHPSCIYYYE